VIVKCIRRCWDGKKARRYYPGDQDDIDPASPIAKYFEFPKEAPAVETKREESPTKNEIMADLTAKGIEFDPRAKKDALLALLNAE